MGEKAPVVWPSGKQNSFCSCHLHEICIAQGKAYVTKNLLDSGDKPENTWNLASNKVGRDAFLETDTAYMT